MTLDEAIKHCEEKEKEQALNGCFACAEEHKQLAEWLKELKRYREADIPRLQWEKIHCIITQGAGDVQDFFCGNCAPPLRRFEKTA